MNIDNLSASDGYLRGLKNEIQLLLLMKEVNLTQLTVIKLKIGKII